MAAHLAVGTMSGPRAGRRRRPRARPDRPAVSPGPTEHTAVKSNSSLVTFIGFYSLLFSALSGHVAAWLPVGGGRMIPNTQHLCPNTPSPQHPNTCPNTAIAPAPQ